MDMAKRRGSDLSSERFPLSSMCVNFAFPVDKLRNGRIVRERPGSNGLTTPVTSPASSTPSDPSGVGFGGGGNKISLNSRTFLMIRSGT